MWHQFYQNLLNKVFAGVLCALAIYSPVHAEGILDNYKALSEITKENHDTQIKILQNQSFSFQDVADINTVALNTDFINSLLINTPARYFELGDKDKCTYYDLILSNIFQGPNGNIKFIIFDYIAENKSVKTALARKREFKDNVIKKQCPGSIKLNNYFSGTNLRTTLQSINLKQPKNISECSQIMKDFKKDVKSPYICSLTEVLNDLPKNKRKLRNLPKTNYRKRAPFDQKVKFAESLNKILKPSAFKYIDQICRNVNDTEKFCKTFFADDFWGREFGNKKSNVLSSFCSKPNSKSCLKKLSQKSYCHFTESKNKTSSLRPWPNCEHLSTALSYSRLFQNYKDCPANIGNNEVISWSRILNHFDQKNFKPQDNCEVNATLPVAKFTQESSDFNDWKVHICYDDKIQREEVCYPTLLDNTNDFNDLSLATNVGKVLKRLRGFNNNKNKCRVITSNEYKPTLLQYKNGCVIIKDANQCWGVDCAFKVILNETEFKLYTFKSELDFQILPINYVEENKSLKKIYEKTNKRTFKRILNISALQNILKIKPNTLIYGIGCQEDMLPSFFKRDYLNQCKPLSFIVDGLISKEGLHSIITRTAIDHIHAPRIIPWVYLFSSIKSYQKLHPLNTWGLYAIY